VGSCFTMHELIGPCLPCPVCSTLVPCLGPCHGGPHMGSSMRARRRRAAHHQKVIFGRCMSVQLPGGQRKAAGRLGLIREVWSVMLPPPLLLMLQVQAPWAAVRAPHITAAGPAQQLQGG
jgi:hypothetical protein